MSKSFCHNEPRNQEEELELIKNNQLVLGNMELFENNRNYIAESDTLANADTLRDNNSWGRRVNGESVSAVVQYRS